MFSDHGFYKIECKTKTSSGVEFTSNGSSNHDSGKVNGSLETKYKYADYGELLLFCIRFIGTLLSGTFRVESGNDLGCGVGKDVGIES